MYIEFQSIHFTADQKLKDYIIGKLEKLERYFDNIIEVNVLLKLENSGQVRDKIVEIIIKIPGERFIATNDSKTFEASFDSALETMKKQMRRHKEKMIDKKRAANP